MRRIVIVGGGAAGAELACVLGRRSRRALTDITLVDCAPSHLWKPRLHEVAVGQIGPGEDAISYLALARMNGFRFRLGALEAIDPVGQTIQISEVVDDAGRQVIGARQIAYDDLILAFGSQVNDFGVPGVLDHCHRLDTGDAAAAFQRALLKAAVRAADAKTGPLRIGIVGGGATGVELAAELDRAIRVLQHYGVVVSAEITIMDMGARLLAAGAPEVSAFAEQRLKRAGVILRLNAGVEAVTADGFQLKCGGLVACDLKVWASGVVGHPPSAILTAFKTGKGRRLKCTGFLSCDGFDRVYALGDCAEVIDGVTGRPLPMTAQVAHQQATYLARMLSRGNRSPAPFRYRPGGSLVSLGEGTAAGEIPRASHGVVTFRGHIPKMLYIALHLTHRAKLLGCLRTILWFVAERLRQTSLPAVKLH